MPRFFKFAQSLDKVGGPVLVDLSQALIVREGVGPHGDQPALFIAFSGNANIGVTDTRERIDEAISLVLGESASEAASCPS